MIENTNASKNPSTGSYVEFPRFTGVASINVKAINPNNAALRKFGWDIPENAEEPVYMKYVEQDGKQVMRGKVRFLVQIQDLEDKPIIPLDFYVRPGLSISNEKKDNAGNVVRPARCKVIDAFGRTAWGTKEEVSGHKIPQYENGPADISTDYKACAPGQEDIVRFLFKYLNLTPLKVKDNKSGDWVATKTPGRLTIDNWDKICSGDVSELVQYIALQPDNCVKVVLGIQTDDDNHNYQTFLRTTYIGNGARVDVATGEYPSARKAIDKFKENNGDNYIFSAAPVKRWTETATAVKDNSASFFDNQPESEEEVKDDLPF